MKIWSELYSDIQHFTINYEDIPKLKNFDLWLDGFKSGKKYNLDKDLIMPRNTVYSKETCQFVTEYLNKSEGARNGKPYTKKSRVATK